MPDRIPTVKPGSSITADHHNRLVERMNASHQVGYGWGNPNRLLFGSDAGPSFASPPVTQIRLVEILDRMIHRAEDGVIDDVLSANCKIVWYHPVGDPAYSNQYEPTDREFSSTEGKILVYFPTVLRRPLPGGGNRDTSFEYGPVTHLSEEDAENSCLTVVEAGDRIYVLFNHQSGRWEYFGQPSVLVRFELLEDLSPGGHAQARIHLSTIDGVEPASDNDQKICVYDWIECFKASAGDKGYARRFADMGRWEIIYMCTTPTVPYYHTSPGTTIQTLDDNPTIILFDNPVYELGDYWIENLGEFSISDVWGPVHVEYDFTAKLKDGNKGTGVTESEVCLEIDLEPNGTWQILPESKRYGTHNSLGSGYNSIHGESTVDLLNDSKIRLVAKRTAGNGTLETVQNSSKIRMSVVDPQALNWSPSSGGS